MRLADFIVANVEPILAEWELFARGIWPEAGAADPTEMRDEAEDILRATVVDMQVPSDGGATGRKVQRRKPPIGRG